MARKDSFIPKKVYQMVPIKEGDREYGYAITKLYDKSMSSVMRQLFVRGASGMVCGERKPKGVEYLHKIISSQTFSRPEDYSEDGSVLKMSDGFHISCKYPRIGYRDSLRWYQPLRFQGDFEKLLGNDFPNEETGTIAVALAGNLAINNVTPGRKTNGIIVREIKIASMHPDKEHKEPWLATEFDIYVHNHFISPMVLPRDIKSGYVPLDALEKLSEGRED